MRKVRKLKLNKIYNMDCLELMKEIPEKYIDLIVTDPPYLMNYMTNHRKDKNHEFTRPILNDTNEQLIKDYIKECSRILKENSAIYCFANSNKIDFFKVEIEKHFNVKNIIVWVKNSHTAGDLEAQYGKQYEFIIYANKGRKKINGKRITDVWHFDRVVGNEQIHQNQKPLDLIKRCIIKSSEERDIVFDGFMGSGTTAVSAKLTNRKFIGTELDEIEWCKAIKRLAKFNKDYLNELPKEERPSQLQMF